MLKVSDMVLIWLWHVCFFVYSYADDNKSLIWRYDALHQPKQIDCINETNEKTQLSIIMHMKCNNFPLHLVITLVCLLSQKLMRLLYQYVQLLFNSIVIPLFLLFSSLFCFIFHRFFFCNFFLFTTHYFEKFCVFLTRWLLVNRVHQKLSIENGSW